MLNSVCLIGRLTKDLELRQTQSGNCYVGFTLAVRRNFVKDGQPESDFINCVAWGKTAETMCNYLFKGSLIGVDGRIQTRNYDNQQGQRVYVTEVVCDSFTFLESRAQSQANQQPANNGYAAPQYNQQPVYSQPVAQQPVEQSFDSSFDENDTLDIASDDLPF